MSRPRLILMRHGETAWNAERRYTTRSDLPLNDAGLEHAGRAAEAFAAVPPDRIWTSPAERARVTAAAVAERCGKGLTPIVDERLREVDAGPFEGLTPEEIEAGPLAADYAAWHRDDDVVFPAGAETYESALGRIRSFVAERFDDDGMTLVVTHGSLARLYVATEVLGARPERHRRLWLDNGRSAAIELHTTRPRLVAFNVFGPGDPATG